MNKDDLIKKSYDFAADLSKQMITLSTAIITLCVAFTDKLFTTESAIANSKWLIWSLGVFIFSIAVGIFNLMGLTGQLGSIQEDQTEKPEEHTGEPNKQGTNAKGKKKDISIYSSSNRLTSIVQVITFVLGLILALVYIVRSSPDQDTLHKNESVIDTTKCIKVIKTSDYAVENGQKVDTLYLQDLDLVDNKTKE